ncbi:MAG: hypothetical protein RLZZ387_1296 [Chloroflexota bacterium]|jgi:hypothetical protein
MEPTLTKLYQKRCSPLSQYAAEGFVLRNSAAVCFGGCKTESGT